MAREKKKMRLVDIVDSDTSLKAERRLEWKAMAELYSSDFAGNLTLTSIELDDKYGVSADDWQEFLNYPPIRKYITSFREEQMVKQIDDIIVQGKGSAGVIKAKEMLKGGKQDNSKYVLFRLPEKVEVFEGDYENGIVR